MTKLIAASMALALSLAACSGSERNTAVADAGNDAGIVNDVTPVDETSLDNNTIDPDVNSAGDGAGDPNAADAAGNGSAEATGNAL